MFDTILLAYDGSDHARNALKIAAQLTRDYDARLHLSHTPQSDMPPIVLGAYAGALDRAITAEAVQEAGRKMIARAEAEAEAEGVAFEKIHKGAVEPARALLEAAETTGADLIVMGRRGLGSLGALTLGSVSLSVAHSAKCACLTVF